MILKHIPSSHHHHHHCRRIWFTARLEHRRCSTKHASLSIYLHFMATHSTSITSNLCGNFFYTCTFFIFKRQQHQQQQHSTFSRNFHHIHWMSEEVDVEMDCGLVKKILNGIFKWVKCIKYYMECGRRDEYEFNSSR